MITVSGSGRASCGGMSVRVKADGQTRTFRTRDYSKLTLDFMSLKQWHHCEHVLLSTLGRSLSGTGFRFTDPVRKECGSVTGLALLPLLVFVPFIRTPLSFVLAILAYAGIRAAVLRTKFYTRFQLLFLAQPTESQVRETLALKADIERWLDTLTGDTDYEKHA